MALMDEERGVMAGIDRRLLVVALALALLTGLAVLDRYRPVPGSEPPVDWRLPVPMARPSDRRADELLGAD